MSAYDIPDHPVIRNMELTGYPDCKEPCVPRCPICREEVDFFYKDKYGDIVGCEECVSTVNAWDELAKKE